MNINRHCKNFCYGIPHKVTLVGGFMIAVTVGVGGLELFTGIKMDAKTMAITAKIIMEDVTPNAICTRLDGLLIVEFPILVFFDTDKKVGIFNKERKKQRTRRNFFKNPKHVQRT
jgi:hypothetical protein